MNFGDLVNSALIKAGLLGYANSGLHNPHLNAQVASLISNVILPKLPVVLEQQLITPIAIAPQGMRGVLLHYNSTELSSNANSTTTSIDNNLLMLNNPNEAIDTEQVYNFGTVKVRVVEVPFKIDRIVSLRLAKREEHKHFPVPYPDRNSFSYSRKGDNDILVEFITSGLWDNEELFIDAIPQFEFKDITSPIDIPANIISYIIVALAYELATIYSDRPDLVQTLSRELRANLAKATDLDDWTKSSITPSQRLNRF